ncbi:hypothetical protein BU25DRAFT_109981 [Macroventuria anomochaeta]|uniref:Uncharacterized protein n=1 Tax=Macroventuria anomochaeta TaxID=301207 RepID=A0ACB6RUK8_9PLEO|nr:uncharacterized protein BU25DRAFT_109981 [Macroventuria anomochaeta]KAF2625731.1 hypothetical protein BU25DRAFT_109981 [Macroventuria anomochaeta]
MELLRDFATSSCLSQETYGTMQQSQSDLTIPLSTLQGFIHLHTEQTYILGRRVLHLQGNIHHQSSRCDCLSNHTSGVLPTHLWPRLLPEVDQSVINDISSIKLSLRYCTTPLRQAPESPLRKRYRAVVLFIFSAYPPLILADGAVKLLLGCGLRIRPAESRLQRAYQVLMEFQLLRSIAMCHGSGCSCLSNLTCHESDCHVTLALFTATHLYVLSVASPNTTSVQSVNSSHMRIVHASRHYVYDHNCGAVAGRSVLSHTITYDSRFQGFHHRIDWRRK